MAELTSMMNIGKEMARKLDSVGIGSAEEIEGCSPASIPMLGVFGITTSRRRNGCLMERPCYTAVPQSCVQHGTMISRRRRIFPTKIYRWMFCCGCLT